MMRTILACSLALLVAACGQKAELARPEGAAPPPVAYGAREKPDTEKLLEPDPLAAPVRSVELRRRSEEREDDAFDLPPE